MTREISFRIEQDEWTAGRRSTAGEFLRRRGFSRHLLTYLRHHENTLLLNGEAVFTNHPILPGDVLTARFTDEIPSVTVVPSPMELNIVHEDEDILVIDKPPYLPIQPSLGHYEHTLGNGVAAYYHARGIPFVYRCVNRLDRNTSGLVIIAKNMASSAILYEEMKNRRIHRTYFTVVHGRPDDAEGVIDLPIARKTPSLMERCVDPVKGQRAVTHFRELSYQPKNDTTALSVRLETGRTHQIRVHMSWIGHPVVGDSLYGIAAGVPSDTSAKGQKDTSFDLSERQALHSWQLDFMHPITRQELHFEAPLPDDIRSLL